MYVKVVVMKPERIQAMPITTNNNNAGLLCLHDLLHNQICKQEWAEVVRRKLRLKSLGGKLVIYPHDAGIVDRRRSRECPPTR